MTLAQQSKPEIHCTSHITHVVMHGRGALVTRLVTPNQDDDISGEVDLIIPDITARAEHHSAQIKLHEESNSKVLSLHGSLHIPDMAALGGDTKQQRDEIEQQLEHVKTKLRSLNSRREMSTLVEFVPARHASWLTEGPLQRMEHTLNLSKILQEYQERLDVQRIDLEQQREELKKELQRLNLIYAQEDQKQRASTSDISTQFRLALTHDEPTTLTPFEITYVIRDARWWPLYTLRLTDGGSQASMAMEAMVTQDSGEDWNDITLALSTADLDVDAKLPELAALKLGKHQPTKRTGYREAPESTERLFSSYDQFSSKYTGFLTDVSSRQSSKGEPEPEPLFDLGNETQGAAAPMPAKPVARSSSPVPMPSAPPQGFGAAAPSLKKSKARAQSSTLTGSGFAHQEVTRRQRSLDGLYDDADDYEYEDIDIDLDILTGDIKGEGGGGFDTFTRIETVVSGIKPADTWMYFFALQLGDGQDSSSRGELQPIPAKHTPKRGDISQATQAAIAEGLIDPRVSRGHYDYRYEGHAKTSVPSDALNHRIEIQTKSTTSKLSWQCVPLETEEVFRLAHISNPFDGPMLSGPVDVFVEGSYLLTTKQAHVDHNTSFKVGLGVDERIRVARNVRTEEEQLGLLGGKTSIEHTITTELTSNLGFTAQVEVLDRIPVAGHDDVTVKELDHSPPAKVYKINELQNALDGGRLWRITLEPGQTQNISSCYSIVISAKHEVQGGNRRD